MKQFSLIQTKLIHSLSDGVCHSGKDLGMLLQVSRTAVWKQLKQLRELGLPIQSISQQGYRLTTPLILLDEQAIRHKLTTLGFNGSTDFHLYASLDSTNRLLKDLPRNTAIDVCCAEMQTEGRGRFGRHWHSPFGENIYCSSRWRFDCDLSRLSGLSLVVSLAILEALADVGVRENIHVKWPNDILWGHKKLCGSLIEMVAESNNGADVVIGIGLNVNSDTEKNPLPDKPWCSLYEVTGRYTDRNTLIAHLIIRLNQFIDVFMREGFMAFASTWQQVDYLQGKMITLSHLAGPISGKAQGVNEVGQLILVDEKGERHELSSGDTTLHG